MRHLCLLMCLYGGVSACQVEHKAPGELPKAQTRFAVSQPADQAGYDASCAKRPVVKPVVLDCWGRRLEAEAAPWDAVNGGTNGWTLEADGFAPTTLSVAWGGAVSRESLQVTVDSGYVAYALVPQQSQGGTCPVYQVLVGLEHRWFACTGRAPSRNEAELFTSGESMFGRLAQDLAAATKRIHGVTWWWQSDLELVRSQQQPFMTSDQRKAQTMGTLLASKTSVERRIIVERFASMTAGGLAYVNTDPELRGHAYDTGDSMEVMVQGNPTPIPLNGSYKPVPHPVPFLPKALAQNPDLPAGDYGPLTESAQAAEETYLDASSWHQKSWTIDGTIAYVGGMNVKAADWDSDQHGVFDARRMLFKTSNEERQLVVEKRALPDVVPRKDYSVRVVGPIARDLDEVIQLRWEWGRQRKDLFHEFTTPYDLLAAAPETPGGVLMQLIVTLPEPFGERSILESLDKALRNATDFIYVEDQYFRMPVVLDAFKAALAASPTLHVVVVTPDVSMADGAKKWTLIMDEELRKAAGERYLLLRLRSYDIGYLGGPELPAAVFQDINLHSKQVIVDDIYMNVGSCNKNNRGLLLEGEMNLAILDSAFVTAGKVKILQQLTGDTQFGWGQATGAQIVARLAEVAAKNEAIRKQVEATGEVPASPPSGFVYPLAFTSDYLLDVGPDVF